MNFKNLVIIQARMGSKRLPGKSMTLLAGREMIWHIYQRVSSAKGVDHVVVATSINPIDDPLVEFLTQNNIPVFRGNENDLLSRFIDCVHIYSHYDGIIRVTGDNPLISILMIEKLIEESQKNKFDYLYMSQCPLGLGSEWFLKQVLLNCDALIKDMSEREHVLAGIWNIKEQFKIEPIPYQDAPLHHVRLTVDEEDDLKMMKNIYQNLYQGDIIPLDKVVHFLESHKEVQQMNQAVLQKRIHCE